MFFASISMRSTMPTSSLPGSVSPVKPLALAHEELDAEFVFQIEDVLADAGLRGEQRIRHLGEVESCADRLADDAQLLEVHGEELCRFLVESARGWHSNDLSAG